MNLQNSPRIPISTGFYIQIKNGKAINPGGKDPEAISLVVPWIDQNPNNPEIKWAEEWLRLKRHEVEEEKEIHEKRAKRVEVDAEFDRKVRTLRLKDREWLELLRWATRKIKGVEEQE